MKHIFFNRIVKLIFYFNFCLQILVLQSFSLQKYLPELSDNALFYRVEGEQIFKENQPVFYKGVNALQTYGLGNVAFMNQWNIELVREFIGNIRQPIPLWLTSMEDMVDNLHNSCFDNIILVPRNKQGQSEAALLAKGLELIKTCPNLLFDLHAYEKWLVDQSEANIWQRIQRLQSHPLC